jgi:hypothetical protein
LSNACSVWSSWYVVTPCGVVLPIWARIESRTARALALLMVTLPLSMMWPPPADAIHSSVLQVSPSYAFPWKTKPAKFGFELRSPAWIFLAIAKRADQVFGGPLYPYFRNRSVR